MENDSPLREDPNLNAVNGIDSESELDDSEPVERDDRDLSEEPDPTDPVVGHQPSPLRLPSEEPEESAIQEGNERKTGSTTKAIPTTQDKDTPTEDVSGVGVFPVWVSNIRGLNAAPLARAARPFAPVFGATVYQIKGTPDQVGEILCQSRQGAEEVARSLNGSFISGQIVVVSLNSYSLTQSASRSRGHKIRELQPVDQDFALAEDWSHKKDHRKTHKKSSREGENKQDRTSSRRGVTKRSSRSCRAYARDRRSRDDSPIRGRTPDPDNNSPDFPSVHLLLLVGETVELRGDDLTISLHAEDENEWRAVVHALQGEAESLLVNIRTVLILENALSDEKTIELTMLLSRLSGVTKVIFPPIYGFWTTQANLPLQLLGTAYRNSLATIRNVCSLRSVSKDVIGRASVVRITELVNKNQGVIHRVLSFFEELPEPPHTKVFFGRAFSWAGQGNSGRHKRVTLQIRTFRPLNILEAIENNRDLCNQITDCHLVVIIQCGPDAPAQPEGWQGLRVQLSEIQRILPRLRYLQLRLVLEWTIRGEDLYDAYHLADQQAAFLGNGVEQLFAWGTTEMVPYDLDLRLYYDAEFSDEGAWGVPLILADTCMARLPQQLQMLTIEETPERLTLQSTGTLDRIRRIRVAFHQPTSELRPSAIQYTHEGEWSADAVNRFDHPLL